MKDIIVFGTGKYFEWKKENIKKKYHIIEFLDNKVKPHSELYDKNTGIRMINPEDMKISEEIEVFIMSVHLVGMWKQLVGLGVNPNLIKFPYAEQPFFENEEALCTFLKDMKFEKDCIICFTREEKIIRISEEAEWKALLRKAYYYRYPLIGAIANMNTEPISLQFGTERGTPVDRYYIEQFLKKYSSLIRGDVLEIEDNTYTKQFGKDKVDHAIVMDVSSNDSSISFCANLETGEGIRDEIADCFILTQTLMYLFDVKKAAHNIGRLLKKGGFALITCSGISQNSRRCMDNYGCYFNFNANVFNQMFREEPSLSVVETGSYGNVKTVSAHINGLCHEDLKKEDYQCNDKYYPLIVYAVVRKNER